MRYSFKPLVLLLLLLLAQQGAVVHELSHATGVDRAESTTATALADSNCALCPVFSQVSTPAFSHSVALPPLSRTALELSADPLYIAVGTSTLTPRSRGPPV